MNYENAEALRMALDQRIVDLAPNNDAATFLRKRILFERLAVRLEDMEPGLWVLKGGMALSIRLGEFSRYTQDIDWGLRHHSASGDDICELVRKTARIDIDGDFFQFDIGPPTQLAIDEAGVPTWRLLIVANLAGREFVRAKIDVSPRPLEVQTSERIALPNVLDFAGVPSREIEIVNIHRHLAEKFHALTRDFGDRPNSRVRDLVDIVLIVENGLADPHKLRAEVDVVFAQRGADDLPTDVSKVHARWDVRYAELAEPLETPTKTLEDALKIAQSLWDEMLVTESG